MISDFCRGHVDLLSKQQQQKSSDNISPLKQQLLLKTEASHLLPEWHRPNLKGSHPSSEILTSHETYIGKFFKE